MSTHPTERAPEMVGPHQGRQLTDETITVSEIYRDTLARALASAKERNQPLLERLSELVAMGFQFEREKQQP